MILENILGAAVGSLFFVVLLMVFIYIYYSLGLPLMLLSLFLLFLFIFQSLGIQVGSKVSVTVNPKT